MAPKRKLHSGSRGAAAKEHAKAKRSRTDADAAAKLYTPKDLILVLGDGDFTFSKGLVKHRGTGDGVFATSFDSDTTVRSKYTNAEQCINDIRSQQGKVFHDVDATKLDELPLKLKDGAYVPTFFKYIIFNFPHSGEQRVHINRALLRDFFESARPKLFKTGEVHVTLKTKPPYSNWNIEEQAKAADFVLKERRKFNIRLFPGYNHRTTDPLAKKFEPDLCVTYVFIVNRAKHPFEAIAKTLREKGETTPPQDTSNTAIAQLLAAHARAKAAATTTAPVPAPATSAPTPALALPGSRKTKEDKKSKPVVTKAKKGKKVKANKIPAISTTNSAAEVVSADSTQVKGETQTSRRGLWTPLHRPALTRFA